MLQPMVELILASWVGSVSIGGPIPSPARRWVAGPAWFRRSLVPPLSPSLSENETGLREVSMRTSRRLKVLLAREILPVCLTIIASTLFAWQVLPSIFDYSEMNKRNYLTYSLEESLFQSMAARDMMR